MESLEYDSSLIRPIRPPEVEGESGAWTSRWLLTLREQLAAQPSLTAVGEAASSEEAVVRLTRLDDYRIRLEVQSPWHPLDVEAYLPVDAILVEIDRRLGELAEINGSPRDWWRPFRQRAGREG